MSDTNNAPVVVAAPGVTAQAGDHEHWYSPRNIIAFALIGGFIFFSVAPYVFTIPAGRSGDLIVGNMETLRNITLVVLAFYFGTTVNSQRDRETIRQQALQQPVLDPVPAIRVEPPATLKIEEPAHAEEADARGGAGTPAASDPAPRLHPGDVRPPE